MNARIISVSGDGVRDAEKLARTRVGQNHVSRFGALRIWLHAAPIPPASYKLPLNRYNP